MTAELKDRLQQLEKWESPEIPILSLYLNLGPSIDERKSVGARLRNLLEPISGLDSDLEREARMALRKSVDRLLGLEHEIAANTGHCVAVFVGGKPELNEFLALPRKAWDRAMAGPRPYLRPYLAALDQFHRIATVVVDPRAASITTTYMREVIDRTTVESPPIRKSDYAGWHGLDEHRVRQHAEEVHRRHYRQVAEQLQTLQLAEELDVIFVGGRDEAVAAFLQQLPGQLTSLVAETFTVDVHTLTPGQLTKIVAELEERYEKSLEERLVTEVIEAARGGGLGLVGVEPALHAANLGAIDLLLIAGTETLPGYVCDHCGWMSLQGPDCRSCGEKARAVPDIIESLVLRVRRDGANAEHVLPPSQLNGDDVAARLRFQLPSAPV
ncbi:MAG TPA: hypothetical protein VM470_00575 [Acidimicrobiia bacterium]|nr:hypothetical protein [Acidimicrobiia bacterium]